MIFTDDFSSIIIGGGKPPPNSLPPSIEFPMNGKFPIVSIDFDGTLAKYKGWISHRHVGNPIPYSIWALRTFKHNGWEVEIFSAREEVGPIWRWIHKFARGLVDRVNETRPRVGVDGKSGSSKPLVDLFIDDRDEYWFGREINWVEIMIRLSQRGFLHRGLLPLEKERGGNKDMVEVCREPVFREILEDIRRDIEDVGDTRESLIKEVERSLRSPEILGGNFDIVKRAKLSGKLLESVLKLIVRDSFDPVGCILLAQKDRECNIDTVPPLPEINSE